MKYIYPKRYKANELNSLNEIINRCNISMSIEDVIKYVFSRFSKDYKKTMPKRLINQIHKHIEKRIALNINDYQAIISGNLNSYKGK